MASKEKDIVILNNFQRILKLPLKSQRATGMTKPLKSEQAVQARCLDTYFPWGKKKENGRRRKKEKEEA